MIEKNPVYPCRSCKYYSVCGNNMRTMPCKGRETKKEEKQKKKEEEKRNNR